MASKDMMLPALGRPFTLGMLYDARQDKLIPGFTLWDDETLQKNTVENPQQGSSFTVTRDDSMETKSSLLEIEASLKASVLCGLIEVGGSAKYLTDKKKFKSQSRVALQYKCTTIFKQLSMTTPEARKTQQVDDLTKNLATHVVTAILYGANAFFVFDSQKLETSQVQDFQTHMEVMIKKIPSFSFEAKVDVKMSQEEKAMTEKFSCNFHGDFILERNPATFQDAVKAYQELPKLLGPDGKRSVPMKVWLMPLKKLEPTASEMMSGISVGIVRKVQEVLEDVAQLEMRCNDFLEDNLVQSFPQIHEKLSSFQRKCNDYRSILQETIAKKLPSIRDGKEDESSTEKLFEDRLKSPFSNENLKNWLLDKERQINIIKSCVSVMKGTDIAANKSHLDKVIFTPGVQDVLCFVFTSLESDDPFLDQMGKHLQSHEQSQKPTDFVQPSKNCWYTSDEVITRMRGKAKLFQDLAKELKSSSRVRFLVMTVSDEKIKGASLYHYSNGKLVTSDFSKPSITPLVGVSIKGSIHDKNILLWYAVNLTMNPNTVNNNLTLSADNKKATRGARQSYVDHPERFDSHQVMCNEGLSGYHYWEVEWGDGYREDVAVGVAYKKIARKGDNDCWLGETSMSWCFGIDTKNSEVFAGHNDHWWKGPIPSNGCKRVGVFLDWPSGIVSYYQVLDSKLNYIICQNYKFTEPVYPTFFIKSQNSSVSLCPIN